MSSPSTGEKEATRSMWVYLEREKLAVERFFHLRLSITYKRVSLVKLNNFHIIALHKCIFLAE